MAKAIGKLLIVGRLVWHPSTHRKVKWFSVTTKGLVQTEMVLQQLVVGSHVTTLYFLGAL